jgi:quercetin dioxygenase-like cupin family protein
MTADDRLRTHPKDRLAAPVQTLDLAGAAAQLRAEPHAAVAGHRQVALVRRGPLAVILFAFEPDGALKEHVTDGDVLIQVLRGRLAVDAAGETITLGAGGIVALAPGERHAVRALEASEMLLTIAR